MVRSDTSFQETTVRTLTVSNCLFGQTVVPNCSTQQRPFVRQPNNPRAERFRVPGSRVLECDVLRFAQAYNYNIHS